MAPPKIERGRSTPRHGCPELSKDRCCVVWSAPGATRNRSTEKAFLQGPGVPRGGTRLGIDYITDAGQLPTFLFDRDSGDVGRITFRKIDLRPVHDVVPVHRQVRHVGRIHRQHFRATVENKRHKVIKTGLLVKRRAWRRQVLVEPRRSELAVRHSSARRWQHQIHPTPMHMPERRRDGRQGKTE